MPGQLTALSEGPDILLDKPILLLGRHPECDIQLNSRKISRKHCCIAQIESGLLVRDLGSTNGIRVNGARVLEAKLIGGDELTIGNFRFIYEWKQDSSPLRMPEIPPPVPKPVTRLATDSILEEAEEPIPLDENEEARAHARVAPTPPAPPVPPIISQGATLKDSGVIFPDHLTLSPQSGSHLKPPENNRN